MKTAGKAPAVIEAVSACPRVGSADLGNAIRALRRTRRVTIDGLAHAAEMHPTYLSSIERGERNPSWLKLCDLARALGVSVATIAKHAETGTSRDTATATVKGRHLLPGDELLFLGTIHRVTRLTRYAHPRVTPVIGSARIAHVEGHERGFMTVPDEDQIPVTEDTAARVRLRLEACGGNAPTVLQVAEQEGAGVERQGRKR